MRAILPTLLTRQPQQPARVDVSTELGRMLAATVTGSQYLEPVSKAGITLAAGVSRAATQHGIAFQHSAADGSVGFGATGGMSTVVVPGTAVSVFLRVFVSVLGVRQALFADHDAAGTNESFNIEITAANAWRLAAAETGGVARTITTAASAVTAGWHDVLAVHRPGIGNQLYIDGISVGTLAFTASLRAGVALRLGSFGTYPTLCFQGRTAVAHIFRGDVSGYLSRLIDNPWQVLESPPRRLWAGSVAPAGGGAITMPAAQGSYTITGNAATLRVSRKLVASPGAYTITGAAAGLRAGRKAAAAQGVYTLTGNPASLRVARRLIASPGTYAITGNAANLVKGTPPPSYVMPAAQGNYTITGRAATLRIARRLVAAPGSYALTGFATAVPAGLVLAGTITFRPFRTKPMRVVRLA